MKREGISKHLLAAFVLAAALYVVAYSWIEHLRTRKGGWQVAFTSNADGIPSVTVSQPELRIQDVQFLFANERISTTNSSSTIVFDRPITNVPFGRVIYMDTTFLPGSVVLGLFGHEVQLLPRVLVLDHKEIHWQNGAIYRL